jgi:hypothetical protein
MDDVDLSCPLTTMFSACRRPPLCGPPPPPLQPPSPLVASCPPRSPSDLLLALRLCLNIIYHYSCSCADASDLRHLIVATTRRKINLHHFFNFGFSVGELQDPGRTLRPHLALSIKLRHLRRC